MKITFGSLLVAWLAVLALAGGSGTRARASSSVVSTPVDVEIAIDGTGSMTDAVARAANQATELTTRATGLLPDLHFAVVAFRDAGASLGEYQLLQPFTSDTARVKNALDRVKTKPNPGPGGPESYNLVFNRSYSDARMGWRPSARKIVLVIGDAEPNGAGTAGLPGCRDKSTDPHGLSTPTELAHMRAAERTLIMVRMHSSKLSVSLQCYQSIAAGGFVGGAARDEGSNLAAVIVELIERAYAPVTLAPDLRLALRSGRAGYTLTLHNPNALPVTSSSVSLVLPRTGFRYVRGTTTGMTTTEPTRSGRTLLWRFNQTVAEHRKARLHVIVRTAPRLGMYHSSGVAEITTAGGNNLTSRAPSAALRVRRGVRTLLLRFTGSQANGTTLRGTASTRFSRRIKSLPAGARARGSLVVSGRGTRVVLRARRLRLEKFAAPTRARLALRVVAVRGLRRCSIGGHATLVVVDSAALRANDLTSDSLLLTLPAACGGKRLLTTAAVGTSAT
jgi:von Willebrand factor type A domain